MADFLYILGLLDFLCILIIFIISMMAGKIEFMRFAKYPFLICWVYLLGFSFMDYTPTFDDGGDALFHAILTISSVISGIWFVWIVCCKVYHSIQEKIEASKLAKRQQLYYKLQTELNQLKIETTKLTEQIADRHSILRLMNLLDDCGAETGEIMQHVQITKIKELEEMLFEKKKLAKKYTQELEQLNI